MGNCSSAVRWSRGLQSKPPFNGFLHFCINLEKKTILLVSTGVAVRKTAPWTTGKDGLFMFAKLNRWEIRRRLYKVIPIVTGLLVMAGCCLVLSIFAGEESFFSGCQAVYSDTLRLHIRAASDSEADQQRKLLVRDALVQETARLTEGASDKADAEAILGENLEQLRQTAIRTLQAAGSDDPVSVSLSPAYFNTRQYQTTAGDLTLPAGEYDALVVTIGEGEGHNWWCVLYPSLCLPAATEDALALYSEEEQAVVTEGYTLRFWVVEMLERLAAWASGEEMAVR